MRFGMICWMHRQKMVDMIMAVSSNCFGHTCRKDEVNNDCELDVNWGCKNRLSVEPNQQSENQQSVKGLPDHRPSERLKHQLIDSTELCKYSPACLQPQQSQQVQHLQQQQQLQQPQQLQQLKQLQQLQHNSHRSYRSYRSYSS